MEMSNSYPVEMEENNVEPVMVCPSSNNLLAVYNNKLQYPVQEQKSSVPSYKIERPIGFALLLGCSSTPSLTEHLPIKVDLELMESALKEGGWFIQDPCLNSNDYSLTRTQCKKYLDNLNRDSSLRDYSCFMFYYTGHGNREGMLLNDGSCVPYSNIVRSISSITCLQEKPKIFIFDCCNSQAASSNSVIEIGEDMRKEKDYPPSHSVLAFSTCEGMDSYANRSDGSCFTRSLSDKLKVFGKKLSFLEILTFVNGGTAILASHINGKQRSLTHSTLDQMLVLNCDGLDQTIYSGIEVSSKMEDSKLVKLSSPINSNQTFMRNIQIGLKPEKPYALYKGSNPNTLSSECSEEMVSLDAVTKDPPPNLKFKTKQDVTSNIRKLGQGLSVFVCYVPDPESPHSGTSGQRPAERNLLIRNLICDLEHHGFTVISDLHLGDTQPSNWLIWYTSRIKLCDYLIMVCSPAFKEAFSSDRPTSHACNELTRFLGYRNILYKAIVHDMVSNSNTSKAIPVILDQWEVEDSVPALFGMTQTYQLYSKIPRRFNYDDKESGFERLVCRMAGINRMELDKPFNEGIQQLPQPYASSSSTIGMASFVGRKPRKGYQIVKQKTATPSVTPQIRPAPYSGNVNPTPYSGHINPAPYSGHINPAPYSGHINPAPYSGHINPAPYNGDVNLAPYNGHVNPAPYSGHVNPAPYSGHVNPAPYNGHINPAPYNGHVNPAPYSGHINPAPYGGHINPAPPIFPASTSVQYPPITPFPERKPDRDVILWLCEKLTNWRFIARHLGISEPDIEAICNRHPHDVREQRVAMFYKWERQVTREYSYRTLGDVLSENVDNKMVYPAFCEKVAEIERKKVQP